MSTPHIAWAFAQRKLTAAQRVVLIALAERANGERTCFPSEETLAADCELTRRTVIAAVQYLRDERRLIEVITDPVERASILAKSGARKSARANVYRILRPAEGEKSAPSNKPNGAKYSPSSKPDSEKSSHTNGVREKSAHLGLRDSEKSSNPMCKKQQIEREKSAHEPLTESLHEKKREDLKSGEEGRSTPPAPPTTPGSGTQARSSNAFLDDPSPADALPCEIEQEVVRADLPDPDAPVDPEYVRAVVAELKHEWRSRAYPPRLSDLTRDEQATVCRDKPSIKSAYLPDAVLRLQRKQAGIRHAANA